MNLSLLGIITAIIGAIAGYIAYLKHLVNKSQEDLAIQQSQAKQQEWADQIKDLVKTVNEKEIDYAKARDDFKSKYGDGSGEPGPK